MRRTSFRPYFLLILFVLGLMSVPEQTADRVRSVVVLSVAPTWRGIEATKRFFLKLLMIPPAGGMSDEIADDDEIDRLKQENQLLKTQLEGIKEWLLFEDRIESELQRYRSLSQKQDNDLHWKEFFRRRSDELARALDLQVQSLPATVVFREPASWSSALWINVGERDNESLGRAVVVKNSPVLVGTAIIGVVEYVGYRQSRVRLISDSGLVPSVRAVRGTQQNRILLEQVESLLMQLHLREDLFTSSNEAQEIGKALHKFKEHLGQHVPDRYLAKGELCGSKNGNLRTFGPLLRGTGFNYDFADSEGPARDLRAGTALESRGETLLKTGDLLVTTGFDGVFPPGFKVAIVAEIERLREGACSYEIEAIAAAGNLDDITHVFVLPPMEFE